MIINPKISVVIPTFNRQLTIINTIKSIMAQTEQNFEIIIVDDGSRDNTYQEISNAFGRGVCYVYYEANHGPSWARNRGVEIARGKYVAFLDSDDCWEKEFLFKLSYLLDKQADIGVAYCDSEMTNSDGSVTVFSFEPYSYSVLLKSTGKIPTGALMFRRELYSKSGGMNEELRRGEDFEWQLRMGALTNFMRHPGILHYYYRRHDGLMNAGRQEDVRNAAKIIEVTRNELKGRRHRDHG